MSAYTSLSSRVRTTLCQLIPTRRRALQVSAVALAFITASVLLVLNLRYFAVDFRLNLWQPAYLLVHGQSPYYTQVFPDSIPAVWLPQIIGLFFPLGWLDLQTAANLWLLVNLAILVVMVRWYREGLWGRVPLLAAALAAIFPPLFFQLEYGQFDLMATLFLMVATRLVLQNRYIPAGILLALVLSKPQLAVLAIPGLWIASLRGGGKRAALVLPIATVVSAALLTLPFWIGYPGWVPDFVHALQSVPPYLHPSLYTIAELYWGRAWLIIPALISLALFGLNAWLWWRYPPEEVLPWSLALTTIASPYMWTWNFVLVLPLLFRSLYRQRALPARLVWAIGLVVAWSLIIWLQMTRDISFHWQFWMPYLLLGLALGAYAVDARGRSPRPPLLPSPAPEE